MEPAMDLYGDDRKLSELSEELNEFLDSGAFTPTSSDSVSLTAILSPIWCFLNVCDIRANNESWPVNGEGEGWDKRRRPF